MPGRRIEVAAIVGSLRRQSHNRALLRTTILIQPETMHIYEVAIDQVPFFNEDLEREGDPPSVVELKRALAQADAVLILTPEYSYSISGVLKNALDWASRPPRDMPLSGKPLAIMGAGGRVGTVRAQLHLRQIAVETNMLPLNKPQVHIARPSDKFDAEGRLIDATVRDEIQALLMALGDWTRRLRGD